ncbi:MAG: SCO family protein [Rhodocyclaceae bacterium]|nr:SCO family protein [Rhodocyclaceae bacterium]
MEFTHRFAARAVIGLAMPLLSIGGLHAHGDETSGANAGHEAHGRAHSVTAHMPSAHDDRPGATVPNARWGKDYFPNIPLIDQDGRKLNFFDDLIKDKVVAINFIFTSCSDSCPLETARLREVTRILGDRVGRDVFFYSISIDPKNDTPEVLKAYTEQYGIGSGWLFLTGNEDDIVLLRRRLGLYLEDIAKDSTDHNLNLIIGNQRTGRWQKSSPFENPYILATQLGSWLHNWKLASAKKNSYDEAPKLRKMSRGEQLFRTRCSSCHNIGADPDSMAAMRQLAPDLLGVTKRRERAWLERWLREPDQMLAEKDPIATALLAEYNNLTMPNFRLGPVEIQALLEYLDEEGDRMLDKHASKN